MKDKLIECFRDTLNMINTNPLLLINTKKTIKSTRLYYPSESINYPDEIIADTAISVIEDTTFHAAQPLTKKYDRVAVLNFASAVNPGGGVVKGAMAQEECLCRSSNLLPCLKSKRFSDEYYSFHRAATDSMYSDRLIYLRDITVFKTDDDIPRLMAEADWFNVDVITCAAPNMRNQFNVNKYVLRGIFKNRIRAILNSAIDNDVDAIVLGAFGCGAFRNPPELVARAFRDIIWEEDYQRYFKEIVFAIKPSKADNANFVAFKKAFSTENYLVNDYSSAGKIPFDIMTDEIDREAFIKWQESNYYFGKSISILGDSISTLAGFNPPDYSVFYENDVCDVAKIRDVSDTWWGKVIDFLGGKLLVNNSWSGSKVSGRGSQSGCSPERTKNLHIGSSTPDVVIIYLGFNDWANGVEIAPMDYILDNEKDYFEGAYCEMLSQIRQNYPDAEICCCTINTTTISNNEKFQFPFKNGGIHIEEYNEAIKAVADSFGCTIIDLYSYGLAYNSIDGSHPDLEGMRILAMLVCRELADKAGRSFFDCKNSEHSFVKAMTEEKTGVVDWVCKKCALKEATIFDADGYYFDDCYKGSIVCGKPIDKFISQIENQKVSKKQAEEKIEKKAAEKKINYCKKCGERALENSKFCIKCGANILVDDDSTLIYCPYCNESIMSDSRFCSCCGKLLEQEVDTDNTTVLTEDEIPDTYIDIRYRLIKEIGKGGSSRVYLANDEKLDRQCAVKIVSKTGYANQIASQMLLEEANKMKFLHHISIPQLFDILDEESRLCIVMEYIEGSTLEKIIRNTRYPLAEELVVGWAKQLCRVLDYLHSLNPPRIFRDIKPSNIMLQPNGEIKLFDFGIMRVYDENKDTDTCNLGTRGFAAPEQFSSHGQSDARTDIFALGITIHYLLTGINPVKMENEIIPISTYRPELPKALDDIIRKCTQVNPDDRYQNCKEVLYDLENYNKKGD